MISSDHKQEKIIKGFMSLDDNLLSFLCGIVSNVPISLVIGTLAFGNTIFEILRFCFTLVALGLSILITIDFFSITLRKISIQREVDEGRGKQEKNEIFDELYLKNKNYFKYKIIRIIILGLLFFLSIIFLWININFC